MSDYPEKNILGKNKTKPNKKKDRNYLIKKLFNNINSAFNPIEHRQQIEVYKQKIELNTPVANSRRVANCKIGDFILIVDDIVWVYDYTIEKREHYSQSSYYPEFIRLNPNLFEKQTK